MYLLVTSHESAPIPVFSGHQEWQEWVDWDGFGLSLHISHLIFNSYIHVLAGESDNIALNELIVPEENSSLGMYLGT